ncbi:MAG: hypothetical protein GAK28_03491 [Luteibacter sp.]|nr:MAG: hypothetical protein GAK28_03491 [Luteibacter sp.]
MHSLPKPVRLWLRCKDRAGRSVFAAVTAGKDEDASRAVWHAIFPGTGLPAGEMLGSSASLDDVADDVCARVASLEAYRSP